MNPFTPLQQRTLQIAKAELGRRERTGHNDGPLPLLVQRFIAGGARWLDGQPWCVCFALWCVKRAAAELRIASELPRTASSSSLYRWYRQRGKLLPHPIPGCVAMVRGGKTGHHHTLLVHAVEEGMVVGVAGNWHNAVGWERERVDNCDFGPIC